MPAPLTVQVYQAKELHQMYMFTHHDCPKFYAMESPFYDIELDRYQYDDLQRNGYTLVEPMCYSCYDFGSVLIKLVKKSKKT